MGSTRVYHPRMGSADSEHDCVLRDGVCDMTLQFVAVTSGDGGDSLSTTAHAKIVGECGMG